MALTITETSSFAEVPEVLIYPSNKRNPYCDNKDQDISGISISYDKNFGWAVVAASSFNDLGVKENIDLNKEHEKKLCNFQELIKKRIEYIDSLKDIPDDWISGKSKKPSSEVIRISKILLDTLFDTISNNINSQIPKLLLGPIPSGGISINIIFDSQNKISVSFFNEDVCEIDYVKSGKYICEDIDKDITISKLEAMINSLIK